MLLIATKTLLQVRNSAFVFSLSNRAVKHCSITQTVDKPPLHACREVGVCGIIMV